MKIVNFKKLKSRDQELILLAKKIAKKSISKKGHKVGCIIFSTDNQFYLGATVQRGRVIGSTCAERMALDQWYFDQGLKNPPKSCYLIGKFNYKNWNDDLICTPCGVCLEMFFELMCELRLKKFKFLCSNWKNTKVLIADLKELFPQYQKKDYAPYCNKII